MCDCDDIRQEFGRRILILDGAMGTMLQRAGKRSSSGVGDLLNLEDPEAVLAVHRAYIDAGADIIETNTFNNVSREVNLAGARLARKAADEAGRKAAAADADGAGQRAADADAAASGTRRRVWVAA